MRSWATCCRCCYLNMGFGPVTSRGLCQPQPLGLGDQNKNFGVFKLLKLKSFGLSVLYLILCTSFLFIYLFPSFL